MWLEDLLDWLLDTKDSIWNPIKWAWQRLVRGWDDRVMWSIDCYLAKMMPVWLCRLKEIQHGYPGQLEGLEKWDEVLDVITDGFGAAKQIQDHDFPAWAWLVRQEKKRYGRELDIFKSEDHVKLGALKKEIGFLEILKAQEDEALEKFNEGMDLFKEYFFDLWD